MRTLASRQLAFLAALGRSALDPFTLDIFGVVDQLVAIGTFVGVAVDSAGREWNSNRGWLVTTFNPYSCPSDLV